jgi:hypothetical protein
MPAAYPGGLEAAAAALRAPTDAANVGQQLKAYQAHAMRWGLAGHAERASLNQALTESPFAQRIQATLNAFTRAAWAGPDAAPPAPQARMLEAFDALSETDQQIVAAMQTDGSGAPTFASPADYRRRLDADLKAAQPPEPVRSRDTITLSDAARAHLAGGVAPRAEESPPALDREVASALAAYRRVAG